MKTPFTSIIPDRFVCSEDADFADFFGDNMILQADKPITIWGFGKPGTHLEIQIGGIFRGCRIGKDAYWEVVFPPRSASFTSETMFLFIREKSGEVRLLRAVSDILIGELWLMAGQSNFEMGISTAEGGKEAALAAHDPALRYLLINKSSSPIPLSSLNAQWKSATPRGVLEDGWGGFSAIGYWFAKELREALGTPVGIIQAAFGGAKIHAFIEKNKVPASFMKEERKEWVDAERQWLETLSSRPKSPDGFISESDAREVHPLNRYDQWDTLRTQGAWNAMIAPALPCSIRGFLWYQGESDVGLHAVYPRKMHILKKGVEKHFARVPFLFAQIAPWNYGDNGGNLAAMWKAQIDFSHSDRAPIISTLDVGNWEDIHPTVKAPVAKRFAARVLSSVYGRKDIEAGSPEFRKISYTESGIAVRFSKDLILKEGTFTLGFTVTASDGSATVVPGTVHGNEIWITLPDNIEAQTLEYGWEGNGTISSRTGEPALPFSVRL